MTIAAELLQNDPASQMLGIRLQSIDEKRCVIDMLVSNKMTNGYGFCHGGFIYTLADTAAAFAGAMEGDVVLSSSNHIDYVLPAMLNDKLTAIGQITHVCGHQLFCEVEVLNQDKKVIALVRGKLVIKNPNKN